MSSTVQIEKSLLEALFSSITSEVTPVKMKDGVVIRRKAVKHAKARAALILRQVYENTRKEFDALPPVVIHRSHGWTTPKEHEQFARFWIGGIPQAEIAKKFAVHLMTVNIHCRAQVAKVL